MKESTIRRLKHYFLLSTAIPFFLIVVITSSLIQKSDREDLSLVIDGYLKSISENISGYFRDLRLVTILPYFSQEIMDNIRKTSSSDVSYNLRIDLESQLDSLLSSVRYTTNDFYSALLVKGDTVLYSSHNGLDVSTKPGYQFTASSWYREAVSSDENIIFLPPHYADYYSPEDNEKRISLLTTIKNLYTREPYAVLKIDVLPSSFDRYLGSVEFHLPSCVYITDRDGSLIYSRSNDSRMSGRLAGAVDEDGFLKGPVPFTDTWSAPIPNSSYTLRICIDTNASIHKTVKLYAAALGLYLLAVIAAFTLFNNVSSRITGPVEELRRVLGELSKGSFSVRYRRRPNWDLAEIGDMVNTMAEDLERLIQNNYIALLEKKEAENRALMSQIQPHFLFNTLNSIISLLYEERIDEGVECIYSLSNMLHYVLKSDSTVTLGDEEAFLRDYLHLQKTRFNNRLEWSIDIPSRMENIIIPRLLLQPFVENSVVHGTEPAEKLCHITIRAEEDEKMRKIYILDDGAGFDMEKTDLSSSIGVNNSIHRLENLYSEATVDISSSIGSGCSVTITVKGEMNEYPLRG